MTFLSFDPSQMQANAIKAKQRSRIRSPSFPPTKKFWHPQHQVPSSSGVPKVPSSSSGSSSVFSRLGGVAKSDDTDGADVPKKKKSHVRRYWRRVRKIFFKFYIVA